MNRVVISSTGKSRLYQLNKTMQKNGRFVPILDKCQANSMPISSVEPNTQIRNCCVLSNVALIKAISGFCMLFYIILYFPRQCIILYARST
jgi:hypothetical protein